MFLLKCQISVPIIALSKIFEPCDASEAKVEAVGIVGVSAFVTAWCLGSASTLVEEGGGPWVGLCCHEARFQMDVHLAELKPGWSRVRAGFRSHQTVPPD